MHAEINNQLYYNSISRNKAAFIYLYEESMQKVEVSSNVLITLSARFIILCDYSIIFYKTISLLIEKIEKSSLKDKLIDLLC